MPSRAKAGRRTGSHRTPKRLAIVIVPAIAAVMVAGAAFAWWTTVGNGTATAQTGTTQAVTVTQVGTAPTGMAPGGSAQAVAFKITNPKSTPQYITTVAMSITDVRYTTGGLVATTCSASDFTLVQPTAINSNLANGDTTFDPSGATILMRESGVNQDDCKNVTVNLAFAAS